MSVEHNFFWKINEKILTTLNFWKVLVYISLREGEQHLFLVQSLQVTSAYSYFKVILKHVWIKFTAKCLIYIINLL